MAARSIALSWQIPAFAVRADVFRGEAVTLTFTRTDGATIAAWTISFRLKRNHGDSSAALTVAGTLVSSGTTGVFTVALTAAQTDALALQGYIFDVVRTDSGSETQMAVGMLNVLEEVG